MEIPEIKAKLTLSQVIKYYGFKADKHNRICCPFHDDKTPSLNLYYKTQTAYCFSSNCPTHGHSMDVIEIVQRMETSTGSACSKHQALLKCVAMIEGNAVQGTAVTQELSKEQFLQNMFTYFKNGVYSSPPAKEYLQQRNLDFKKVEVGYNTGQFHYGPRKYESLIQQSLQYGLLADKNLTSSRTGEKAYQPFGKFCIVFALRNAKDEITGMYFRSTVNDKESKHFYLKNRSGLYPGYPKAATKKLILTEAIIDAATLLSDDEIIKDYEILSCYGTNGLTDEHVKAVTSLKELEEIIFFFDGDAAGREAVNKYGSMLKELLAAIKISVVNTPENEDVNSLMQGHEATVLQHLINERTEFIFSIEKSIEKINGEEKLFIENNQSPETITNTASQQQPANSGQPSTKLNTTNPNNILFTGAAADYAIKGGLKAQLDSLKISLQIIDKSTGQDCRMKIDLYDYKQIQAAAETAAELLHTAKDQTTKDLQLLTHLLENFRETQLQNHPLRSRNKTIVQVPEASAAKCIAFMQRKNLLQEFNKLIGKAGVTGEENNRLFLFVTASSYKMKDTLHTLIQGSSGSGKTRLLKIISMLMPPEDVKRFTRVTENSFYNYGEYDLMNLFLCFEDIDGLEEKALLALRELQSNDILVSSTSQKQDNGHIQSGERIVRGPIASLSCTTKGDYYEDNISRCFVIAVDESKEQTKKIIAYQNKKYAGEINEKEEQQVMEFIQNCIRLLKPYEVINPFANKIQLPEDAHKIRRLNEMYQSIVKQLTIINQYQRKKDNQGRLVTDKEDLITACELLFESIILKVDELDGSLRQFYEKLKKFVNGKNKDYAFNRFEVMTATGVKKTQQHFYINKLVQLEYLKQFGFANKGFTYKISYWDNMQQVRAKTKDFLNNQLQQL